MNKIKEMCYAIFGTLIAAIGINIFFVPYTISSGGASGLGIIINYLTNIPVGIIVVALNIPLFVIAIYKLGFKFTSKALLGTILFSIFIDLTSVISNMTIFKLGNDILLSSIFGGLIIGLGYSLVFKGKASTGGSELLAQIIYKYRPAVSMSQIMLVIDGCIVLLSVIVFKSLSAGLYSLIAVFVSKKTMDIVFEGINYTKVLNIITKKDQAIARRIIEEIQRGATAIKCVGEYTNDEYVKIECVATIPQIYKIKEIVRQEDTEAFMYIAPATEVLGYGFK